MRTRGLVREVLGLAEPMETLRFQADLFVHACRRRALPESKIGALDQFGADTVVVVKDTGFPEK